MHQSKRKRGFPPRGGVDVGRGQRVVPVVIPQRVRRRPLDRRELRRVERLPQKPRELRLGLHFERERRRRHVSRLRHAIRRRRQHRRAHRPVQPRREVMERLEPLHRAVELARGGQRELSSDAGNALLAFSLRAVDVDGRGGDLAILFFLVVSFFGRTFEHVHGPSFRVHDLPLRALEQLQDVAFALSILSCHSLQFGQLESVRTCASSLMKK